MTAPAGTASALSALSPEHYSFGPFKLDVTGRKLWRDDQEVALPSRAFDTLVHLVRHRDRLVDKDELINVVWNGSFVSDDSLVHCVSVIRRALHDDVERPRFVATLPRRGYQFVWQDIELIPAAIDAPAPADAAPPSERGTALPARTKRRSAARWVALAGAAGLLLFVGRTLSIENVPGSSQRQLLLLAQLPPVGTSLASGGMLAPDGRQLAFVARDHASGATRLWVRSLDSPDARAIEGTEGASKPFWSPDSRSIGYFAGHKLWTVELAGESSKTIAHLSVSPAGGTWSAGGVIMFGDLGGGLFAVDAEGGRLAVVTSLDPAYDSAHQWPHFLPDGRHFLYTISSWNPERAGIWVGSLDPDSDPRRILSANSPAIYGSQGYLVYVENDALVAVPFNPATRMLGGEPIPLVRNVLSPRLTDGDIFSMTGDLLSFRAGTRAEQLAWFTRTGSRIGTVEGPTALYNPTVSPDGTQLAATGSPAREPGLWLVDLEGNASTRLAPDGIGPVWSPDGERIAFTSRGGLDINVRSTIGRADETLLLRDEERKVVHDWSPDGRYIVYGRMNAHTNLDLWLLSLSDPESSIPLLSTAANERGARISPDGRWVAYTSDESGRAEVYVQEFAGLGSKRAVSTGGGAGAFWRQDGRELFYLALDRTLMAAEVRLDRTIAIGRPRPLFRAPVSGDITEARNHYVAARDGQRFLVNVLEESPDRAVITVVVNWDAPLSRARDGPVDRAMARAKGLWAAVGP